MFAEDLDLFLDVAAGFAVAATLAGVAVQVLFDTQGAEVFDAEVITTEPSVLVKASDGPAVADSLVIASGDLPSYLAYLAGTYSVRSVAPEPPDGVFMRAMLVKAS